MLWVSAVVVGLGGCSGGSNFAAPKAGESEVLGACPRSAYAGLSGAPDASLFVYTVTEGKASTLYENQSKKRSSQEIGGLIFAPKSHRYAFGERQGKRWRVVADGKNGPWFDSIAGLVWDQLGEHFFYIAERNGQASLVRDQEEQEKAAKVFFPVFDNDSAHYAYALRGGPRKMRVVHDGKPGPWFDEVGQPVFSVVGARMAYRAVQGAQQFIIDGETRGQAFGMVADPILSRDGATLAYWAVQGAKDILVLSGQVVASYDTIDKASIKLSEKGDHFALIAKEKQEFFGVHDQKRFGPYKEALSALLTLSPAGERMAFVAKKGLKTVLVLDGKETPRYETFHSAVFSPDGKECYAIAEDEGKMLLLVNGTLKAKHDFIGQPVWNPQGRIKAIAMRDGYGLRLSINGRSGPVFDDIWPIQFSAEGNHYAYVGIRNNQRIAVINGVEGKPVLEIVDGNIYFSGPEKVAALLVSEKNPETLEIMRQTWVCRK
jgi:hypothetical protein